MSAMAPSFKSSIFIVIVSQIACCRRRRAARCPAKAANASSFDDLDVAGIVIKSAVNESFRSWNRLTSDKANERQSDDGQHGLGISIDHHSLLSATSKWFAAVDVAERIARHALARGRALVAPVLVVEIGLRPTRDRASR